MRYAISRDFDKTVIPISPLSSIYLDYLLHKGVDILYFSILIEDLMFVKYATNSVVHMHCTFEKLTVLASIHNGNYPPAPFNITSDISGGIS